MADEIKDTSGNAVESVYDKFGFDISYDPKSDKFTIRKDKISKEDTISMDDVDYDKWNKKYDQMVKSQQKEGVRVEVAEVNLRSFMEGGLKSADAGTQNDNLIIAKKFVVKDEEEKQACVEILQQNGLSEKEARQTVDTVLSDDYTKYTIVHESSHVQDHFDSEYDKKDLPPEYTGRLNAMSEVKAAMNEAGEALLKYQQTGSMDGFAHVKYNNDNIVKGLAECRTSEEQQKFVAEQVYQGWMDTNMKEGTLYHEQIKQNMCTDAPLWARVDDAQTKEKYATRVDNMFKDVHGLGDVRSVVDANFALTPKLEKTADLQEKLYFGTNSNLKAVMMRDADNQKKYSENLADYLRTVKKVDKDGVRTPEETEQLKTKVNDCLKLYQARNNMGR